MVNASRQLTQDRMIRHLASWINETDIAEISRLGFNSVRVPIGYWNIIHDPYEFYSPVDLSLSEHYLNWLFRTTQKYNLSVLLDLHGAPGSQNGIDHSGCNFYSRFDRRYNSLLSLHTIEQMMKKYGEQPNLIAVELLNEPSRELSSGNRSILIEYYAEAYRIIRKHNSEVNIVINELYDENFRKWQGYFTEAQGYYNFIMDYHLYNWQWPYTYQSVEEHIQHAKDWKNLIEMYQPQLPIIIGEWSMSTGVFLQSGQQFVDACFQSFQKSFGWYLWNWKIERNIGFNEWDVQYQMIVAKGHKMNDRQRDMMSLSLNPFRQQDHRHHG
jgi:glucan 1,3-beta-glucosidase